MTTTLCFPGQPGDPFGDPQVDLTFLELSDGYRALSSAALAVDTDEAARVPGLLAVVDAVAYQLQSAGNTRAVRSLSLGAALIRDAAEVTS